MADSGIKPAVTIHGFVDDHNYHTLMSRFTKEGKGRKPDVNAPPLTNRVLVQLWDIMLQGGYDRVKVHDWFSYLYPQDPVLEVPLRRFVSIVETVYSRASQLLEGSEDLAARFLNVSFEFIFISEVLDAVNLNRTVLLGDCRSYEKPPNFRLTNQLVLELEKFQVTEKLSKDFTVQWLAYFMNENPDNIDKRFNSNLSYRIGKLKSQKKKCRKADALSTFLDDEFELGQVRKMTGANTSSAKKDLNLSVSNSKDCLNCIELHQNLVATSDVLIEKNDEINALKIQLKQLKDMKAENEKLKAENKQLKRKLVRNESKINMTKCHLQSSERKRKLEQNEKAKTIDQLEAKLKVKKQKVQALKRENNEIAKQNCSFTEKCFTAAILDDEIKIKSGENNAYSDNVRQAAILLQSEAGVSSQNVSKVMKIIGKHIFNHDISEPLPSSQTCLNMNAEGLVLSNLQAAEKILDSSKVTLHLDGTSRDHQKVVGHQITLDDGSNLALGFTLVAHEDSNTILDITISLLKRISELHSELSQAESENVFKELLKKIRATMTDRASTMKSFDRKLEEFLKSELGESTEINFLHCNAHFLLGLSDEADKSLKEVEKEIKQTTKESIGRDKDAQFSRFYSDGETCSNRLIRTLCDVLGPRGDQKNGCRIEWKEFCPDTKIPSFKANRFNCYFEAAAAIVHHYDKIKAFFSSGVLLGKSNLKIQSVSQDVEDRNLISCLWVLALFYLSVTGPYWKLINSSATYSDFCHHVRKMQEKFLEWSSSELEVSSVSDMLALFSSDMFGSCFSLLSSVYSKSVFSFEPDNVSLPVVVKCLKEVSMAWVNVTSRQLGSFLDGNFDPCDEEILKVLQNCPLTNLIGESCFGDLDYDIKKRANCSNLQRTASHCIKRNKTCSDYLESKSKSQKAQMFSVARRQRASLVQVEKANRVEMSVRIKEKLAENQQKKIDKLVSDLEKHSELTRRITESGGVCQTAEDVDRLVQNLVALGKSKKQITEIIKDQIRYHKVIKNVKDKGLNLIGSQEEIISKLKCFLGKF